MGNNQNCMAKKKRFKITPAVYLILVKNNKILLSKRFNTGFCDGQYILPSGHLEGNETLTQTMIREIKEEIAIYLSEKSLKLVHIMHRKKSVSGEERLDFFFTAKKWRGEIKNLEPHKCGELSWYNLKHLPKNTIPYIRQAINYFSQKIFYSEYGWRKSRLYTKI